MKYLVSAMFVSAVMCRAFAYEIATGTAISEQHVLTAYEYQLPDLQLTTPQLNEFLRKIAKSDEMEKKAKDRLIMMREANRDRGLMRYGQMEFDAA